MFKFTTAERWKTPIKIAIEGPSGSGKTKGALLIAKGLVGRWEDIGVLDTENASSTLYKQLGPYKVSHFGPPYSPERYIEAIQAAVQGGVQCLVIDSGSHEWVGTGGCLEIQTEIANSDKSKNSYTAWADVTPRHNRFIEAIKAAPIHIIMTLRSKQDYILAENNKGKMAPQKVGLAAETRNGTEYEFTTVFTVDIGHYTVTNKDRTGLFTESLPFIITEDTGQQIRTWLMDGKDPLESIANITSLEELRALWTTLGQEAPQLLSQADIAEAFSTKSKSLKPATAE